MAGEKHYLDNDGLLYYNTLLKSKYLDGASYSNKTLTITKNGSDSVSIKPLLITAQTLTSEEQAQVRSNIGAGSSAFSGNFSDLNGIPTTIAGYGITDASINTSTGVFTLGSNTYTVKIDNGVLTVGSNTWTLSNVYKYKGSVATKAALDAMTQSSLTPGDVYNVEADGQNYAYVSWDSTNNKPVWDALGGTFTITSITNAEIDAIVNPT